MCVPIGVYILPCIADVRRLFIMLFTIVQN